MTATAEVSTVVDDASRARVAKMVTEFLEAKCPLNYTWSYESSRADLRALYEKAKGEQWDGRTYLPWHLEVDPQSESMPDQHIAIYGSDVWRTLSDKNIRELRQHAQSWTLSQFLHGEQGALLATAQIVTVVPIADAKFYAATQVMDEARHVAFGVLSLKDFYTKEINEKERREREEFTYEACRLMRDRFLAEEVWRSMGLPVKECLEIAMHSKTMQEFRRLLFMRIVPNVKRLGLLTPWMREKFTELGILQFEDMPADA
jgi:hypothetical protein